VSGCCIAPEGSRRASNGISRAAQTLSRSGRVQNHDTATKIPQMINDQSRRLMAMAPIQGTGEEYRSCRTRCIDRGMAYPSRFRGGEHNTLCHRTHPGSWAVVGSNQPACAGVVCTTGCTSPKAAPDYQPARSHYQPNRLARRYVSPYGPAARRYASLRRRSVTGLDFALMGRCIASQTGRCLASPGERGAPDAGLSARRTPSRSRNDRARCGCPRENRALQRSGAALQACPGCRTS
jgi:hypothetical protein